MTDEQKQTAERFRCALELHEAGVVLMRQNLRRRFPAASDAEIEERLVAWLSVRPGAEHGDSVGTVVSAAESLEVFPAIHVHVAAVHHLLALKILSRDDVRRPQDLADIRALLLVATDEQVEAARIALRAIERRGYSRGKDLEAELETVLALRLLPSE